jgi:hypothetical protein
MVRLFVDEYWKPLEEVVLGYSDHPQSKSEGDTLLRRRHVVIGPGSIKYIGKESNDLESTQTVHAAGGGYAGFAPKVIYLVDFRCRNWTLSANAALGAEYRVIDIFLWFWRVLCSLWYLRTR